MKYTNYKQNNIAKEKPATSQNYTDNEGRITVSEYNIEKEGTKAISVTGLGGLLNCETSRLPRCLDNGFIVGGLVARRPRFSLQKHVPKYLLVSIYVRG
jgi:hypothetical protein